MTDGDGGWAGRRQVAAACFMERCIGGYTLITVLVQAEEGSSTSPALFTQFFLDFPEAKVVWNVQEGSTNTNSLRYLIQSL